MEIKIIVKIPDKCAFMRLWEIFVLINYLHLSKFISEVLKGEQCVLKAICSTYNC